MSPRAAWRLEQLGYGPVYDYAAGKVDWMAAGLPTVRADTSERRALDDADREPPTCRPDDLVNELSPVASDATFVVVNERRVVVGRYRSGGASTTGGILVEQVMEPGPSTVRAHEPLAPLLERMARRAVDEVIVTTPEGELLGVVRRRERNA
jgi:CBS domain-containing protein